MALPNIYTEQGTNDLISRINQLSPISQRRWGKMNVSQMLAHCCVPYEQLLGERNDAPNALMRTLMKLFFKGTMTNEIPYKPNLPTAPSFIIVDQRDFEKEKKRLIEYVRKPLELGEAHFENKYQLTLGKLSASQWNNMLWKHLDHHLRQFGV
jgi:hypothetical protein